MTEHYFDELAEKLPEVKSAEPALKEPRKFKVLLLNDDYTTMDFVVDVLKSFFNLNEELAVQVMLQIHTNGKGLCGVFTRDIAETKVSQVNDYARNSEFPLMCTMEAE